MLSILQDKRNIEARHLSMLKSSYDAALRDEERRLKREYKKEQEERLKLFKLGVSREIYEQIVWEVAQVRVTSPSLHL